MKAFYEPVIVNVIVQVHVFFQLNVYLNNVFLPIVVLVILFVRVVQEYLSMVDELTSG